MVIIFMAAYNAENTIRRAIDSILKQTYDDYVFYMLDNASEDGTASILEEYAKRDNRLYVLTNKINRKGWNSISFVNFARERYKNTDYYCTLDSDDEYEPNFIERMLDFMHENCLDISACGSDFSNSCTKQSMGQRKVKQNLLLKGQGFSEYFMQYHQFMRTVWGKIYSFDVLWKCNFDKCFTVNYGADTLFAMEAFHNAERVGILAGTLHKYYVSPNSGSYKFDNRRIVSDHILDDTARTFLIDKCGFISPKNEEFLLAIYFNSIKDTLNVLLNAQIDTKDKLIGLYDIFSSEHTQHLLKCGAYIKEIKKLIEIIVYWMLNQNECRKLEGAQTAAKILFSINVELSQFIASKSLECLIQEMPETVIGLLKKDYNGVLEQLKIWFERHDEDITVLSKLEIDLYHALNKTDDELFVLLTEIRKRRPCSSTELNIDVQIHEIIARYPIIAYISADLAAALSQTVLWVQKENFSRALDEFIEVSQELEVADDDAESYILLGQNLSAASDNAKAYIYFKKIWISYLLDCFRNEEAIKEIDEIGQLLQNDEDFFELRKRLEKNFLEEEHE
ncbi:MAG: glycosyltransferase family 2 protein [Sedimentibacter sp.]|uniref:glycosyltransferase family 2 protein n=1 Tax=Sedimentibacter sp. TaxID=1960295 RepID=UPI003158C18B